jgi:hypothetical protein
MAVAEARKQVSDMGYDPFKVKDYSQGMGIFTVTSSHTWLTGLASFYRMGNITLSMENGIVSLIIISIPLLCEIYIRLDLLFI